MRITFLSFVLFFFTIQVKAIEVGAHLKKLVLYQGAVSFNQEAEVIVEKGRNEIKVKNIPSFILVNTLNVSTKSDAFVSAFKHQSLYASNSSYRRKINLKRDSIVDLERQLEQLSGQKKVYQEEWGLLMDNKTRIGSEGALDAIDLEEVSDFYRKRLSSLNSQILQLSRGIENIEKLRFDVHKRISKLENASNKIGVLDVVINSNKTQKIKLDIQYLTDDAEWEPSYNINYSSEGQVLSLDYNAIISNNTGIDWEGVPMSLITGMPKPELANPFVKTKYLSLFDNEPVRQEEFILNNATSSVRDRSYSNDLPSLTYNVMVSDESDSVSRVRNFNVKASQTSLWVEFQVQTDQFIPSDNKSYIIPIDQMELEAYYYYVAVPEEDKEVYFIAKISNWSSLNLLKGNAKVYNEGNYVGSLTINPETKDEYLRIPLGTDARIIVKKEEVPSYVLKKVMGSKFKRTYDYKITIQNLRSETIKLIVEDEIPVSKNSDIDVEVEMMSEGASYFKNIGKVSWYQEVEPSGKEELKLKYSIKYPKDKVLSIKAL